MPFLSERELVKACTVEEASEVQKLIMKANRFGLDSIDPTQPHKDTTRHQLAEEVGDLYGCLDWLCENLALDEFVVDLWRSEKREKAMALNNQQKEPIHAL